MNMWKITYLNRGERWRNDWSSLWCWCSDLPTELSSQYTQNIPVDDEECLLHRVQVYYKLTKWPALSWHDSSVGRALHQYRRGHGFKSYSIFFRLQFKLCVTTMINHVFVFYTMLALFYCYFIYFHSQLNYCTYSLWSKHSLKRLSHG